MNADPDLVLLNGEVHTLGEPDETVEAVVVRDGAVASLRSNYEAGFAVTVDARVVDLEGRTVLPGFVDAAARIGAAARSEATGDATPDGLVEGGARALLDETTLDERDDGLDANAVSGPLRAAQHRANERGVTRAHDAVRSAAVPAAYRDLAAAGSAMVRVHLDYPRERLDALVALGERTGHGSEWVRTGAVAVQARGAETGGERGLGGDNLRAFVRRADAAGVRVVARVADEAALDAVLDAYETETDDPAVARHRIECGVVPDAARAARVADLGVVPVVRPAVGGADGATAARTLLDAGAELALASDATSRDPLDAVARVVDPRGSEGITVTEALRAATGGGAYAGFDEGCLGALGPGAAADLVVLDGSPWEDDCHDVEVAMTVVDGEVVYDGR